VPNSWKRRLPLVTCIFASLRCLLPARAQYIPQGGSRWQSVNGISLPSPGVGAAVMRGHLFWTNNNGVAWTEITPPGQADQSMLTFFFLDGAHGWITSMNGSVDSWDENPQVHIVRTENGGKTWSPLRFDRASFDLKYGEIPEALWFVDARHGWFQWKVQTSSAFDAGVLFSTADGGETWKELPRPPSGSAFRFHTTEVGWMVGGGSNQELYVTHDGGNTWQVVSVPAPASCQECLPNYDVPRFRNVNDGVLVTTFLDYGDTHTGERISSTYVTHSGGKSWQSIEDFEETGPDIPTRLVSPLNGHVIRVLPPSEKTWVQIRNGSNTIASLVPAGLNPRGYIITGSSFVDDLNGWLLYGADARSDLLATTDGGKTFKIITPRLSPTSFK
jgi:photosystem II stability/assembly factor-like uncharacterized protein